MADEAPYFVVVSAAASEDTAAILEHTWESFGESAYHRYERLIEQALHDLSEAPMNPGVRQSDRFPEGIYTYHLALSRDRARSKLGIVRKPRHIVVFRMRNQIVDVLRLIHDAQDLARHIDAG